LRDSPPPFSPGVTGMNTLVAMTTSSPTQQFRHQTPSGNLAGAVGVGVSGIEERDAPVHRGAHDRLGRVLSSTQGLSLALPKLIMPRQTRDTRRPVRPRFTYSMRTSDRRDTGRPCPPQTSRLTIGGLSPQGGRDRLPHEEGRRKRNPTPACQIPGQGFLKRGW